MNNKKIFCFVLLLFLFLFADKLTAQNWFPMEVGNRWDYNVTIYTHGGNWSLFKETARIVGKGNFGTEKEYYFFSSIGIFGHKILRIENDSLYAFIIEDSTECLLLAFNLEDSTFYSASCLEDSVVYLFNTNWNYFGFPDSQQFHGSGYIIYEISKKFGFCSSDDFVGGGLYEIWYHLSGCILSDTTYGVLLDIDELKNDSHIAFQLHQNYPNPFNPSTIISYSIPGTDNPHPGGARGGLVNLKVYDVLGNEIAILVNEEKPAGQYTVEFDGSALTSGIYFYQLRYGSFMETRKMVLMR
jgi:hypothetical protein